MFRRAVNVAVTALRRTRCPTHGCAREPTIDCVYSFRSSWVCTREIRTGRSGAIGEAHGGARAGGTIVVEHGGWTAGGWAAGAVRVLWAGIRRCARWSDGTGGSRLARRRRRGAAREDDDDAGRLVKASPSRTTHNLSGVCAPINADRRPSKHHRFPGTRIRTPSASICELQTNAFAWPSPWFRSPALRQPQDADSHIADPRGCLHARDRSS